MLPFRAGLRYKVSCSQSHEAAELFIVEHHALASYFGDVCSVYNYAFCQLLSQLHHANALLQTKKSSQTS